MRNNLEDKTPTVTIGITAYNRPDLLREAVLSILNQTYGNFELLIGNDYLKTPVTFDTLGINPNPRVKILNYSSNLGENGNMNHLLNLAQAEWFVWLADDDVFHHSFLEATLNTISDEDEVVAVYSGNAAGSLNSDFFNVIDMCRSVNFPASAFIPKYVSKEIELIGCYGLMKTEKLKEIGGMPSLGSSFGSHSDAIMPMAPETNGEVAHNSWSGPYSDTLIPILLCEIGDINYLDSPLVFLRTHEEAITALSSNIEAYISAESDFLYRLTEICNNIGGISTDRCVYHMVNWFRDNEFSVISRNSKISRISVIMNFISHQLKVNYPRIKTKYWIKFSLNTTGILLRVVVNSIIKRVKVRKN